MEPVQLVQMNIYQTNTYRKDLSWLHFDDELMVQERQQVKYNSPAYLFLKIIQQFQEAEHQPRYDNGISYMAEC